MSPPLPEPETPALGRGGSGVSGWHLADRRPRDVLWCTSFDATAISGVVVEFIKLARIFRARGYRVHLDPGYDIRADKGGFFEDYGDEAAFLPGWVNLDRIGGLRELAGYDQGFVRAVLRDIVQGGGATGLQVRVEALSRSMSRLIVRKWQRLRVGVVIVENGTLPENITYTKALYRAIEAYGRACRLGRYVLWRDHDLMWSSEPGIRKYGEFPYPHAVRPVNSEFIQYLALHEEARRRTLAWVPELENIATLHNTFRYEPAPPGGHGLRLRRHYGIPDDAFLIARYTRIIPQKRIDRDIDLAARLDAPLRQRGLRRPVYLFVAGDPAECPAESAALADRARAAGIGDRVVFGGWLAPHEGQPAARCGRYSVRDLLAAADVASFLTSYDYESYGNPIGEAIASRVPYITTRYQAYDTVYGGKGLLAPVMEISAHHDGLAPDAFVAEVADLLAGEAGRRRAAALNFERGRRYFETGQAERLIGGLLAARSPDRPQ